MDELLINLEDEIVLNVHSSSPDDAVVNFAEDILVKVRQGHDVAVELTQQGPQGPKGDKGDVTPEVIAARDTAVAANDAAQAAKNAAETAEDNAFDSAATAVAAKNQAEADKNAAQTARTGAETALASTNTARDAAITARTGAETAKNLSEAARDTAVSARNAAQTAETNAEASETAAASSASAAGTSATTATTAKNAAETARNKAQDWAEKTPGTTVEAGAYSAKHHAQQAAQSASSAQTARTGAETAETNAVAANTTAQTAKNDAETARTAAQSARDLAQTARNEAQTANTNAQLAKDDAESARDTTLTARDQAVSARNDAQTAQTGAEAAQAAAELARDEALASDPDSFLAKASNGSDIPDKAAFREQLSAVANTISLPDAVDLNTVTTSGFYRLHSTMGNGPSGSGHGQMIVSRGGDTIVQMVFPYNGAAVKVRTGNQIGNASPVWQSWRNHFDSVNKPGIADVNNLQSNLDAKAPLASPALTGTPTAPTASQATNNTQIATTAYVKAAIAAIIDSSPGALDTLNELAAALGDDPNFATTINNQIAQKLNSADFTAATILAMLLTVDGSGSGLDADRLDGLHAADFLRSNLTNLEFANPGIGNASEIKFNKTSDRAGIRVTEYENDKTAYEFYMADNPENSSDYFQWIVTDWKGAGGTWIPLKFAGHRSYVDAVSTEFYGGMILDGNARHAANGVRETVQAGNGAPNLVSINSLNYSRGDSQVYYAIVRDGGSNVEIFRGTGATYIPGLGGGNPQTPIATLPANGSVQTFDGIQIAFPASGLADDMYWTFSAWPKKPVELKGEVKVEGTLTLNNVAVATVDYTDDAIAQALSENSSVVLPTPASGTNLNTVVQPGTYYFNVSGDITTALNFPSTSRVGRLIVDRSADGVNVFQEYKSGNSSNHYLRYSNDSGTTWSSWMSLQTSISTVSQADAEALVSTSTRLWTAERVRQAIAAYNTAYLDKNTVGLGNVDNTSDANKPVSTAQQTAIDAKADKNGARLTGDTAVNTQTRTHGFFVSRNSNIDREYIRMSVDDTGTWFDVNNDEKGAHLTITLDATDTETGGGAAANQAIFKMETSDTGGANFLLNGQKFWHEGTFDPTTKVDKGMLSGGSEDVLTTNATLNSTRNGKVVVADSATPITFTLDTPANLGNKFIAIISNANEGDLTVAGTFDNGETEVVLEEGQSMAVTSNGTAHRLLLRGGGAGGSGSVIPLQETILGDGGDTYTLINKPASKDAMLVFVGGVIQSIETYSLAGRDLTLGGNVAAGEKINVQILSGGANIVAVSPLYAIHDGTGTAGPFTLKTTPASAASLQIVVGGVVQPKDDTAYTIDGDQILFAEPIPVGVKWEETIQQPIGVNEPADETIGANKLKTSDVPSIQAKLGIGPTLLGLESAGLSRIIPSPAVTSTEDWNSLIAPGHHDKLMRGNQANGPGDADYYWVEVRQYSSSQNLVQVGTPYALVGVGYSRNVQITRTRYNGDWSPWRRIVAKEDKPSFTVRSHYSGGTGVSGTQIWTDVQHNIGACYSTATGRFTAPVAGAYHFSTNILSRNAATLSGYLARNGAALFYDENSRASTNYASISMTVDMDLAAGDYVTLYMNHDNYGGVYSWFSGHMI